MLTITFTYIAVLAVGIVIGFFLVPIFVANYKRSRKFTAATAENLVRQARLNEKAELRKSAPFKKRLKEVLTLIQTEASENKRELKISFMGDCKTDKELKAALDELRFETYETGVNTLKISW